MVWLLKSLELRFFSDKFKVFKTDTQISRKEENWGTPEKDFQRWEEGEGEKQVGRKEEKALDDYKYERYDQFELNKLKFGYVSTYNPDLYTVPLAKNLTEEHFQFAEKISQEIESEFTQNPHIAEEKGQVVTILNEEEKYGAVLKGSFPKLASDQTNQTNQNKQAEQRSVEEGNDHETTSKFFTFSSNE